MNNKILYIHIGLHKTGTTAIQYFLHNNRKALLRMGICYPDVPDDDITPIQHRYIATLIKDKKQTGFLSFIKKNMLKSPGLVLSSECFLENPEYVDWFGQLRRLFDEVKIIVYLRRQDQWIESAYSYFLKYHNIMIDATIEEWVDGFLGENTLLWWYGADWFELINKWAVVFGRENIIVRKYDRDSFYKNSLLSDFMSIIGIENFDDFEIKMDTKINAKMQNRNEYEFYRITKPFMWHKEQNDLLNRVNQFIEYDEYSILSPANKIKIMEYFSESNEKVASEFLDGDPGIFNVVDIEKNSDWKPYEGFSYQLIRKMIEAVDLGKYKQFHDFLRSYKNSSSLPTLKTRKYTNGFCPICQRKVIFISKHHWLRDHYLCSSCSSIPRERAIMHVIEMKMPHWRMCAIHESSPVNRGASLKLKEQCANYTATQYDLDLGLGNKHPIKGYRSEDLENQTFSDNSFDLVITQDVMEHLFNPVKAFQEIRRTLKPGGMHIFTTPLVNKKKPTQRRAKIMTNEEIKYLFPPEYHGNPLSESGSLVTWHYGYDIVRLIEEATDNHTEIIDCYDPQLGIEGEYLEVIVQTNK